MTTPSQPPTWAPNACTLPTAERPLRLAEFDDLFADLTSLDRRSPVHVRMRLVGAAGLEATVRDLTAREAECCSFFTFTTSPVSTEGHEITLDIEVRAEHAAVLEALARQAQTVAAAQGKAS